ncbi:MAG: hypothetical protein L6R38_002785 [Xanthoria sp. 2 TBL-2021]|nr:MAG: hypothetical protein L6R38_002785 [Xanthoria sp. 2 TBL-2021]
MTLHGLDERCNKPADFYKPCIRTASAFEDNRFQRICQPPVLELVDTVTTWNGLTLDDCETLHFIQGYLKVCLEQLLQPQLIRFRARILDELRSMDRGNCAVASFPETSVLRRCRFHRAHLIEAMLEALDAPADHQGREHDTSSQELLMLYLWSLSCWLDIPNPNTERTAIDIRFQIYGVSAAPFQLLNQAQVMSSPDYLSFESLDVLPLEGSSIAIKPHYHPNISQELGGPHLHVEYCIESNHPWIRWDPRTRAFTGLVPRFSRSSDVPRDFGQVCRLSSLSSYSVIHLLKIDIKAIAVLGYGGSKVRLRKTVRTRITLRVLPPPSPPDQVATIFPRRSPQVEDQIGHGSHMAYGLQSCDLTQREKDNDSGYKSDTANSDSPCLPLPTVGFPDLKSIMSYAHPHQDKSSASISHRSKISERSDPPVTKSEKYNEEAEDLDCQYTPRGLQKKNDACRWLDASVSPKARKRQSYSATTPRTVRRQPTVPPTESSKSQILGQAMGRSEYSRHVEDKENSPIGNVRAAVQLDFLVKCQQDRQARKFPSSQVQQISPKRQKGKQKDLSTWELRLPLGDNSNLRSYKHQPMQRSEQVPAPQATQEDATPLEPLECFNKFSVLQDLSDASSARSVSDSRAKAQATQEDAAPLEPLECFNEFSVLQDLSDDSSGRSLGENRACYPTPPTSNFEPAPSGSDSPRTAVLRSTAGRLRSDTQSTGVSIASASCIPAPPSPTKSSDDLEGGFALSTRRDYDRLKKVLESRQAFDVFRQPGLSQVEKRQIVEALKMSVGNSASRSSSLGMPVDEYKGMTAEESDGDKEDDEWDGGLSDEDSNGDSWAPRLWNGW